MHKIVVDTSAIIAVIANENSKPKIISETIDAELIAPESIHWEIGNAFSALFKKQLITLEQAQAALRVYDGIPIRFVAIELGSALKIASRQGIYAYDAYLIECALKFKSPLLTLDNRLADISIQEGIETIRIN